MSETSVRVGALAATPFSTTGRTMQIPPEPSSDCALCPRLVSFRVKNRGENADWFNAPVPSFGNEDSRLLIVGLAPGLRGANRTGRPFTGDYAGDLLYTTLLDFGFARGIYKADPNDGLELTDCLITNAVRCVPPKNKPSGEEIRNCRSFLKSRIDAMPRLRIIVALGRIAHDSVVSALGLKRAACPFSHGAEHTIANGLSLYDSYHCSRYNTNTGRLTEEMFRTVFAEIRTKLGR